MRCFRGLYRHLRRRSASPETHHKTSFIGILGSPATVWPVPEANPLAAPIASPRRTAPAVCFPVLARLPTAPVPVAATFLAAPPAVLVTPLAAPPAVFVAPPTALLALFVTGAALPPVALLMPPTT